MFSAYKKSGPRGTESINITFGPHLRIAPDYVLSYDRQSFRFRDKFWKKLQNFNARNQYFQVERFLECCLTCFFRRYFIRPLPIQTSMSPGIIKSNAWSAMFFHHFDLYIIMGDCPGKIKASSLNSTTYDFSVPCLCSKLNLSSSCSKLRICFRTASGVSRLSSTLNGTSKYDGSGGFT